MSRMLEALRQIQAKGSEASRGIKPISREELEAFGLDRDVRQPPQHPAQPGEPVQPSETVQCAGPAVTAQPVEPSDRTEADALIEQVAELVDDAAVPEKEEPRKPEDATEPARDAARLAGLAPEEEHLEPYRELADNIVGRLSATGSAALAFTSPGDDQGKTSTLACLAAVLAERGEDEIVAVDADFRNPQLAGLFGVRDGRGLADVLTGEAKWQEVVRKTTVPQLSVLPGGRFRAGDRRAPENLDLLPMLDALRGRYRIVLVDTASLAQPEVTRIGEACDGTYLVIRLGRTGRRAARHAVRLVERRGGRVLGCVLTGVPVAS